jgi:hypothetical protein
VAPVAATKPATTAPTATKPATTAPTAFKPGTTVPMTAARPGMNVSPAHVAPVATTKPGAATHPATPAANTNPAALSHESKPAASGGKPMGVSGLKNGSTVQVASHGSIIVVSPQVPAPSARPASGVGAGKSSAPAPQVDEQITYQYNTLGRRDPFQSMIGDNFVGEDVGGDAPIDVGGMKVVGVVWSDDDKFALVEDGRGGSHVLRRGDKVMNGFVEDLKRDGVVVKLTTDGTTQSVTIPLILKGDKNASR